MDVSEAFGQALSAGNLAALPLALVGGLVAGVNPCCLALYPAASTVCCSVGQNTVHRPNAANAAAFVPGVAVAIAALGCVAAYFGDRSRHIALVFRSTMWQLFNSDPPN